jgi:hypothetical protein
MKNKLILIATICQPVLTQLQIKMEWDHLKHPAPPSMRKKNPVENLLLYNPTTVAFGKVEFKKTWANRVTRQETNWS